MRILIIVFMLLNYIGYSQNTNSNNKYLNIIQKYRDSIHNNFSNKKTSILTEKDFQKFTGLKYFKTDQKYRVKAKIKLIDDSEVFSIPTTTGRITYYKVYAIATFDLEGKTYSLQIYQNQKLISNPMYKDYLFLPFKDKTNDIETYNGGRYINMSIPKKDTIIIDFNKAYNPYCAYNTNFSCPIPPKENHLDIAIKAGVKSFKK